MPSSEPPTASALWAGAGTTAFRALSFGRRPRVAKPEHICSLGGTAPHRLAVAIEDAGWEIRDNIGWLSCVVVCVMDQDFEKSQCLKDERFCQQCRCVRRCYRRCHRVSWLVLLGSARE